MNIQDTMDRLLRPIHAALISKMTLGESFLNEKLHICPLLQNQNRPEQQYESVI